MLTIHSKFHRQESMPIITSLLDNLQLSCSVKYHSAHQIPMTWCQKCQNECLSHCVTSILIWKMAVLHYIGGIACPPCMVHCLL